MPEYLGTPLYIPPNDPHSEQFLRAAGEARFVLQRCTACERLRYPHGPSCPFCTDLGFKWFTVSGKGTIYSYEIVFHPIHPAYKGRAPYPIVVVELDEQRGFPSDQDAIRVVSSLVDANGLPEVEDRVAIGLRVEVDFLPLGDQMALPCFRLSSEEPESPPWRIPTTATD